MKPHFIIDIGNRYTFGLIVDDEGNIEPCTQRIIGHSLRYFFGEILLDLNMYIGKNETGRANIFDIFAGGKYSIDEVKEKSGWLLPYQFEIAETAIPIKHPLKILSSFFPDVSSETMPWILKSCYMMLKMSLDPIFNFLGQREWDAKEMGAVVILPGYFNWRAQLMLHKLFREIGFQEIKIISIEMAVAMGCLDFSSSGNILVLDMENDDIHSYKVEMNVDSDGIQLTGSQCETLENFGWRAMIAQFCTMLFEHQLINEDTGIYRSYIDKAMMGLINGIGSSPIPSSKPLTVTHDTFDKIFLDEKDTPSGNYYLEKLMGCIRKRVNEEDWFLPVGLPLMMGNFENRILSSIKFREIESVMEQRPIERPAYGVAAGLNWLNRNPGKRVRICNNSGIRIAVWMGECIELVSQPMLPTGKNEQRTFLRVFDFHMEESVGEDVVQVHLLWGSNSNPKYNANLCVLNLDIRKEDLKEKRKIWITLDIKRAKSGRYLMGNVIVRLGTREKLSSFSIVDDAVEMKSHDRVI